MPDKDTINYYEILEISHDASPQSIINIARREINKSDNLEVKDFYRKAMEVLVDPVTRDEHDKKHKGYITKEIATREAMRSRASSPTSVVPEMHEGVMKHRVTVLDAQTASEAVIFPAGNSRSEATNTKVSVKSQGNRRS